MSERDDEPREPPGGEMTRHDGPREPEPAADRARESAGPSPQAEAARAGASEAPTPAAESSAPLPARSAPPIRAPAEPDESAPEVQGSSPAAPESAEPAPAAAEPAPVAAPAAAPAPAAPAAPSAPSAGSAAPGAFAPSPARRRSWRDALAEPPQAPIEVPAARLAAQSRRDFLLFTAGVIAAGAAAWWLLPDRTRARLLPGAVHDRLDTLAARVGLGRGNRERALDQALTFDDDVAEALYSKRRMVRTYSRSRITPLRNNYDGLTPAPAMLASWRLTLSGLASGSAEVFTVERLLAELPFREQVTRLVCVEGWSAVAWWGGVRFADLVARYPPAPGARWAALRSSVNLDGRGRPDPYYVSIDLETARHPQALLATHFTGRTLPLAHGAPLRLVVPMKLGLKNIKAITDIAYTASEPADYWNERGYSKYDGL
jgi:DMSO/TMAO reductase YedYZ molybdopterin-dependent catalytic subunit